MSVSENGILNFHKYVFDINSMSFQDFPGLYKKQQKHINTLIIKP